MYQDYRAAWAQLTAPDADFEVVTTNVRGVDIRTYAKAPGSLRDLWLSTAQFADRDYLVAAIDLRINTLSLTMVTPIRTDVQIIVI